jgi:integrase/recombinase XerD
MVYFKVLLNDKRLKSDNIYPVVIRVTHNRNNTTFNTGIRVPISMWDSSSSTVKRTHPNSLPYNKTISEFNSKLQNAAYKLISNANFSFDTLKLELNGDSRLTKPIQKTTFKSFGEQLIKTMLELNQAGNAIIYRTAVNKLIGYTHNPDLQFTEITYTLLNGFHTSLLKAGLKVNSISNYFRTLRAIYNKAIKEKLVDRACYPFLDISVKTERTAKRSLSLYELTSLSKLKLTVGSQESKAIGFFLLSFSLRGASFTDLAYLKPENISKGYLTYKRRKTGKELKIKLEPATNKWLNQLKHTNNKYLLPVLPMNIVEDSLDAKKVIFQWIKTSNKYLNRLGKACNIEEEITTYVSRHTWATIAKRLGFSNEMIAEAMGHEYGNKITNIYLDDFDQSIIDDMNEQVLKSLNL